MNSRTKGKRGESTFANILRDRDWTVDRTRCGVTTDDGIATDPQGNTWSVEIKKCRVLNFTKFLQQARTQAKSRKMRWMLACHIPQTSSWLVLRQGERPVVWR